ncbi:hypothetical protein AX16_007310 [Volvariella volvacea WC 439]|nr:hypothetical protein AX16_007310 [Volvariella volvacea WC 439]
MIQMKKPPPSLPIDERSIDAYMVRVNILWFLSLILSLATVLAGILCTQWLREFQRDSSLLQRDNIPVRFLRFRGLREWKVPQIISSLPVLLQLSVVLFFAGVVDLLWHLHPTVASIVTAIVGATMFFILFTTVAPTLHFLASYTFMDGHLPAPCPYKSPQAWAFYRMMQSFERIIVSFDKFLGVNLFRSLFALLILPLQAGVRSPHLTGSQYSRLSVVKKRFRQLIDCIGTASHYTTWVSMDKYWHKEDSWHRVDSAGGISWIIQNYGHRIDVFAWVIHAVDTLDIGDLRALSQKCNPHHLYIQMSSVEAGLALTLEFELLTLGILLNMPLNWQDDRLGFRKLVHERIIRCINTDPELSGRVIPVAFTMEVHHQEFMPFISRDAQYRGRVHADSLLSFYASACSSSPGQLRDQVFYTLGALTARQGGVWNTLRYMKIVTQFVTKSGSHSDMLLQEVRPGWNWIKEWYLSKLSSSTTDPVYTTRSEIVQLDKHFSQYCPEIRTPNWLREVNARAERNATRPHWQSRPYTPPHDTAGSGGSSPRLPPPQLEPPIVLMPPNGTLRLTPRPSVPSPPPPVFVPPQPSHTSVEGASDSEDESPEDTSSNDPLGSDAPSRSSSRASSTNPVPVIPGIGPLRRPAHAIPLPNVILPESPPFIPPPHDSTSEGDASRPPSPIAPAVPFPPVIPPRPQAPATIVYPPRNPSLSISPPQSHYWNHTPIPSYPWNPYSWLPPGFVPSAVINPTPWGNAHQSTPFQQNTTRVPQMVPITPPLSPPVTVVPRPRDTGRRVSFHVPLVNYSSDTPSGSSYPSDSGDFLRTTPAVSPDPIPHSIRPEGASNGTRIDGVHRSELNGAANDSEDAPPADDGNAPRTAHR